MTRGARLAVMLAAGALMLAVVSGAAAAAPTVTSFSPTSGAVGATVTITGAGFTGVTSVLIGGVAASSYTFVSDTQITATVPSGASTGQIGVTTGSGTGVSAGTFTVTGGLTSYKCGSPAVTPCWTAFTVDGNTPSSKLQLKVATSGSGIQWQIRYSPTGSESDLDYELNGSGLTSSSDIHFVLDLGTYDPVVFGTTGRVSSFSESTGSDNTVTVDLSPQPSSWSTAGCTISSCGDDASNPVTATNDYTDVALGFVDNLSGSSAAVKDAMRGTWLGTNAQSFQLPSFDSATGQVQFKVAAPHFKLDGTTINQGFFQSFLPDALVTQMGIADPSSVGTGSFTVTNSNGGSTTFSVSHTSSPAGVLIESGTNPPTLPLFSYSTPTFTITKAARAPGAPIDVSATPSDRQVTVEFHAPTDDGGAAITSYTVTASPGGATATGSASPITVAGLSNGRSYTFTVTATNSAGTSAASAPSSDVVPTGPSVPGAPTGVSATAGDGEATVSFAAPGDDGGATITSYTVTASPGGATATGGASPITVAGLTNGQSYTFTVTATNTAGTGTASFASAAVTPTAPAPATPSTPSTPAGSSGSGSSGSSTTGSGSSGTTTTTTAAAPAPVRVTSQSGSTTTAAIAAKASGSLELTKPAANVTAPTVDWQPDTFGRDVTVTAVTAEATSGSTPPPLSGFSAGSVAVELRFSSDGTDVHTFAAPLEIVFPQSAGGLAPGYSTDGGATWTAIPHLTGTTLPDGQKDGYYVDGDGNVHILTLHATYFGLLGSLVLRHGTLAKVKAGSRWAYLTLTPERSARAAVTLTTPAGRRLRTVRLSLPAATTKVRIPMPQHLTPGTYLVRVAAVAGPSRVDALLHLNVVARPHSTKR